MSLVTVKNKFQVIIPRQVREKLRISPGDVLEAKAERGKIIYIPKAVLDRDPSSDAAGRRRVLLDALRAVQADARKKGLDNLTMREIDALIAEARGERKQKPSSK